MACRMLKPLTGSGKPTAWKESDCRDSIDLRKKTKPHNCETLYMLTVRIKNIKTLQLKDPFCSDEF